MQIRSLVHRSNGRFKVWGGGMRDAAQRGNRGGGWGAGDNQRNS